MCYNNIEIHRHTKYNIQRGYKIKTKELEASLTFSSSCLL